MTQDRRVLVSLLEQLRALIVDHSAVLPVDFKVELAIALLGVEIQARGMDSVHGASDMHRDVAPVHRWEERCRLGALPHLSVFVLDKPIAIGTANVWVVVGNRGQSQIVVQCMCDMAITYLGSDTWVWTRGRLRENG